MVGHTATEVVVISVRLFLALVRSTGSTHVDAVLAHDFFVLPFLIFPLFLFCSWVRKGGAARSGPFRNHPELFSATDHWLGISTSGHGSLALVILGSSAFQGLLALVQRSLQDRRGLWMTVIPIPLSSLSGWMWLPAKDHGLEVIWNSPSCQNSSEMGLLLEICHRANLAGCRSRISTRCSGAVVHRRH